MFVSLITPKSSDKTRQTPARKDDKNDSLFSYGA